MRDIILRERQAQTPQQRRANAKFAKSEEKKMGKPESAIKKNKKDQKSPVSKGWIIALAFVVCGGLVFEVLQLVPEVWNLFTALLAKLGLVGKGD